MSLIRGSFFFVMVALLNKNRGSLSLLETFKPNGMARLRNGYPVATHWDVHLYHLSPKFYKGN
jgi:hypothetical protein